MEQPVIEGCVMGIKYRTMWIICLAVIGVLLVLHLLSYFIIIPIEYYITLFFFPVFAFALLALIDNAVKNKFTEQKPGLYSYKTKIKLLIRPWIVIPGVVSFFNM